MSKKTDKTSTISNSNNIDTNAYLDTIFNELGSFGRYQIQNYLIFTLPIIFNGIFTLSYVFTAGDLNYRCQISECENTSNTVYKPLWLYNAVPYVDGDPERCYRYQHMTTNVSAEMEFCQFERSNEVKCNQFIYEGEERTIVNDFDINCSENKWKLTLVGTISNAGQFVCLIFTGYVSDKYGRRITIVLGLLASGVVGIIRSFSPNYIFFVFMEFLDQALGSGAYSAAIILAIELVASDKRVLGGTIISSYFSIGEALLGVAAMYIRNWRNLIRVTYIPVVIIISYFWIAPESIRWLLSKGRKAEALTIIKKAAKINKVELSEVALSNLYEITQNTNVINVDPTSNNTATEGVPTKVDVENNYSKVTDYPILGVIKSPIIILRLLNCSFCWLTNTFVFYGLSLNSISLSGNKYHNFIYVSLIEIPGYFVAYFGMNHLGRRISLSGALLLSGLACFTSEFIPEDEEWLKMCMFLIGKFAITVSFTVLYVYTSEFFPTNLRHSLLGTCSMFGRIGSMVAPQTPLLERTWSSLPLVLFGGTAVLSGLLVLQFPETLGTVLPNTITEAEEIGRKRKGKLKSNK